MSARHIQITPELVEYIRKVTPTEPEVLTRLREETLRDPLARMQITPEQGALLKVLMRLLNARRAIEVGVFTGYSSICVAQALPDDGKLIACDISEEWTAVARRYWREAGVDHKIELRLAPAIDTLDGLLNMGGQGQFDFVFIDADKTGYGDYYERALELLRRGGLIGVDNTLWSGRVIDAAVTDEDTVALRAFNTALSGDDRVWLCQLPIGDGLTLAVKK